MSRRSSRVDLAALDFTVDREQLSQKAKGLINHPFIFATGVGVANGLMAAARDMKFSTRATLATAAVLAIGETILALDHPPEERGNIPLTYFAALSALGVLTGLAMFTDWRVWAGTAGHQPLLIAGREAIIPPEPIFSSDAMPSMAMAAG